MKCDRCGNVSTSHARFCSSCGAELAINLIGEVLGGRYRVLSFIGSGGMGRVYRGEHTLLERPVAVKVLAPEYARDRAMWDRFRREALAASRIAHPHIAATQDFGYESSLVYSVMEYVDGTPLDAMPIPMDVMRALEITRQIAQALGAAHDAGVVHRDVKPGNVIVGELGGRDFIKVVDFGLAVLRSSVMTQVRNTGPGMTMGTPAYVSPEQVLGESVDARSDVYSLGAVLYEMVVGQPPFGYSDTAKLSVSHAYKVPALPSSYSHVGALPDGVEESIMRMLAKAPKARPADGNTVAAELTELLGQISSQVPALTRAERTIVVVHFENLEDIDDLVQREVVDTIKAMGGRMARSTGDEFIGYFESPAGAVAAAARLAVTADRTPSVAVHHGAVELSGGGGVFGTVVNVALRMARLSAPGEALASDAVRAALDHSLQDCLVEGGRLRLGDRSRSVQVYRVTGFTSDSETTQPPVVIGEVRGKSTVVFTCSCGHQGVLVVGKLRADKAIRIRCNGCSRQLSVIPVPGARDAGDLLDNQRTGKLPELRDQLIVDVPSDEGAVDLSEELLRELGEMNDETTEYQRPLWDHSDDSDDSGS